MDEKNPLVSLIIPCYNTKEYLSTCLAGVVNQTYAPLEIIFVDDGSTDGSGEILAGFAREDTRVQVFTQKNQGVSAARNLGLAKATGSYICFLDSDDYICKSYIQVLLENIIKYDADISCVAYEKAGDEAMAFQIKEDIEATTSLQTGESPVSLWEGEDIIRDYIRYSGEEVYGRVGHEVHTKLFRRESLENLSFSEQYAIAEDKLFVYEALKNCRKCVWQGLILYAYRVRANSAMHSPFSEKNLSSIQVMDEIYQDGLKYFPDLKDVFYGAKFKLYAWYVQLSLEAPDILPKVRKELIQQIKACDVKKVYPFCDKRQRLRIGLIRHCLLLLRFYVAYQSRRF